MFYKVSAKNLLSIRNNILLNAIPTLEEQGFEKSPFTSSWYGRNNLGDFSYYFARLSNSCLELIHFHICRGDRWIQGYLNIFELSPIPKTLSELKGVKGMAFNLPPDNLTRIRLDDMYLYENRFRIFITEIFGINGVTCKFLCEKFQG